MKRHHYVVSKGSEVYVAFSRTKLRAVVQEVLLDRLSIKVSYPGWARYFDEHRSLDSVVWQEAPRDASDPFNGIRPKDRVRVRWGTHNDEYEAQVMSMHREPMLLVHFDKFGEDWDQLIPLGALVPPPRKSSKRKSAAPLGAAAKAQRT